MRQLCGLQAARMQSKGYSAHRLYCDYYAVERVRKMGLPSWRGLYHGDLEAGLPVTKIFSGAVPSVNNTWRLFSVAAKW